MKQVQVFFFFFLVAFLFYKQTAGAGFVTDEIGWLQNYETTGWKGIFNAFNDKSPHFIYHLFGFGLWKLFHLNGFAWMTVFVALHALVATLSFVTFKKLFSKTDISSPKFVSLAGSLIFLLSPYNTEPLVWYACIHYLVCSALVLVALNALAEYNEKQQQKFIWLFYFAAFVSAFTLEISFSLPFITALIVLFFPLGNSSAEKTKQFLLFVFPSLVMVLFYFVATKTLRGNFAGHYGAATHFNLDVHLLMGNLSKYCTKVFGLMQFSNYETRNSLYVFFEKEKFSYLLFGGLCSVVSVLVVKHKQLPKKLVVALLLLGMFVLALLPILNLYFSSVVNVEGDRFTYFASVFAGQFIAFALVSAFSFVGWLPIGLFILFSAKYLLINTSSWHHNGKINSSLCEKFSWYDAPHIYLLNMPDNYNGTYMFRSFTPDNSFAETLALRYGKDVEFKVSEILEYNMNQSTDGVVVEKISEQELKVKFTGRGNWWWSKGIGASSYSNENYEVKIDEWGVGYSIVFKNKIEGAVYLYQCGNEWKVVEGF